MKRTLTLLLWTLTAVLLCALNVSGQRAEQIAYDYDHITVAGVTPTTGSFFTSLWGNATSDIDVRLLLHGYNLVEWRTESGTFLTDDTVVSGLIVTQDGAGNRTYTVALYNDLYYSDGTRITAADYAFSMLLTMSPEMAAIGGDVRRPEYLVGYSEYISGAVPYLAGVRLLADDQLSITVSADYLPFFYELGLLDCTPYPISVIAPGVRVADDGNGVYLTNIEEGEPVFTADLLRKTILDPQTGYLTYPSVTSGPYRLVSYDGNRSEFEVNDRYKGDVNGFKPRIRRLSYISMPSASMVPAFRNGSVTVLHKVTNKDTIAAGMETITDNTQLAAAAYPRSGLAFISFNTERPIVNETEVRQALAYATDRKAITESVTGEYGITPDGYYGKGQWMYQMVTGDLSLSGEDAPPLDGVKQYPFDLSAAADLLDSAGWNLSADGSAYGASGSVRYKMLDGSLVPLRLTMAYPQGTSAAVSLRNAAANMRAAGIEITLSEMPLSDLLDQYYGMAERQYDMFFLASNFDVLFDPSAEFETDEAGRHVWKETGFADEELYSLAAAMRMTEPGDRGTYVSRWLDFQRRFAEVLPMLPIYSNYYFDFYPKALHNYDITSKISWSLAVIPAYMSDPEPGN